MVITTCSCHHTKSDLRTQLPLIDSRGPASTERSNHSTKEKYVAEHNPTGSIKIPSSGDRRYTTPEYNAVQKWYRD